MSSRVRDGDNRGGMDNVNLENLERIAILEKVTRELESELGIEAQQGGSDLAEFLVSKAQTVAAPEAFVNLIQQEDAEFPNQLAINIHKYVTVWKSQTTRAHSKQQANKGHRAREKLPALTLPNDNRALAFGEGRDDKTEEKLRQIRLQLESNTSTKEKRSRGTRPRVGQVYDGQVTNLLNYGCFVKLVDFQDPHSRSGLLEGLVRRSDMLQNESISRGDDVKVKLLRMDAKGKLSLEIRSVIAKRDKSLKNDGSNGGNSSRSNSSNNVATETGADSKILDRNKRQNYSEGELWEMQQLKKSGVLPSNAYSLGQETSSSMNETDEDLEIEPDETEPPFLIGQTEASIELTQIKVVRNPDGSMSKAAENQAAITKERRQVKRIQELELANMVPKNVNTSWLDPMSEAKDRSLASELRGPGLQGIEVPEWKQQATGKTASFGIVSNKSLQDQQRDLPIFALKDQLKEAFKNNQVLIVIGETGSGKTTQMPQYLSELDFASKGIIGCTQPRRVAAVSVAKRVAEEVGCQVGQEVGYTIRFEDCTGPETKIKFMTDGMLMREYLMDGMLSRYSVIILDEAHERGLFTDVLFALIKLLLKKRSDLKFIVTSATLDADKFSQYFFECPIFTIPGRSYDVQTFYSAEPETDYLEAALLTVMEIHIKEPPGDILLFLTGQEEIDTACEALYQRSKGLGRAVPELIILPAYGSMPSEMQSRIFEPAPPGTRKLVVATNIAEASITLDGIMYVVDPGYAKQNVYNPKLRMDSLCVVPISQASARQRAGRAGRTGPGKCYRLYTELAFKTEMLPTSVPEIQRTNLASTVLQLKAMGVNDLLHFDFMDRPPAQTLVAAMENLYALGALDQEGLLTKVGRKMAEFPLDPVLAKTLIASVELGCAEEVVTVVAMLSVENLFYRPKDKQAQADQRKARFHQPEGDHLTLLAVYEAWKKSRFSNSWCFENYIQARSIRRSLDIRKQLVGILNRYNMPIESCGRKLSLVQMAIASGFFMHTAKRDPQEGYRTVIEGHPVNIHPGSSLFHRNSEWVLYHELVMTTKEYMRNVMRVDPKWLLQVAPNFFKKSDPNHLSKRKRNERIEPLYDKYNAPDSWRLSKRRK